MKIASLFASLPSYAEGERLSREAGVMVESVTSCLFKIQGKRCTSSWRGLLCLCMAGLAQGRGRGLEYCNDVCGNQTFMKTAHCHHLITSMIGAHGDHSTEVT